MIAQELEVLQLIRRSGALKSDDHFVGVSGKHFDSYLVKDILFSRTSQASRIGEMFALRNEDLEIDVVVGPATGGIVLSQWTAFHLSRRKGKEVFAAFTDKTSDGGQVLGRGYDEIVKGRSALVLEDSVRTGGTISKVLDAVTAQGGEIAAVSAILNVSPGVVSDSTFGVPFRPLADFPVVSFGPSDCPMCKRRMPVNTIFAHGKKFLEANAG